MRIAYVQNKDGLQFYGYDAIGLNASYLKGKLMRFRLEKQGDDKMYIGNSVFASLSGKTYAIPTKGSKLYLSDKNPYAVADIRKNYTIVRNPDKADYIMFSYEHFENDAYWRNCIVFPKVKLVVYYEVYYESQNFDKIYKCAKTALLSEFDKDLLDEHIFIHERTYLINGSFKKTWETLLGISGNANKLARYDSLNMSTGDEVTLDSLKILSGALLNKYWTSTDENNASTILMTFHNFDYREIPGTMSRVFDILMDNSALLREMSGHTSRFSKPVRDLLQTYAQRYGRKYQEFASQDDFNLCYQFIESMVNVGDSIVVKHDIYDNKLNHCPVSEELLNEMYNVVVRVTPKKYEDFISAKQDGNPACAVQA